MKNLTNEQFNELSGFFTALQGHYHYNNRTDFQSWAERLDKLGISWKIQNAVAIAAENRQNGFLYFRTVLTNSLN
jgi:hypothetical protein